MLHKRVIAGLVLVAGLINILLGGCVTTPAGKITPGPITATPGFSSAVLTPSPAYPGPPATPALQAYVGPPATPTLGAPREPKVIPSPGPTTPVATWPVVIPATATPSGATAGPLPGAPPIGLTPVPTIQLPPDRTAAFATALENVPEIQLLFQPEGSAPRVEAQTQAFLPIDVDGDGREEFLWGYLLRYVVDPPHDDFYIRYISGHFGLALFDGDDKLLWYSVLEDVGFDIGALNMAVEPVVLAAGEVAILYSRYLACACNALYSTQVTTLYRWDGSAFQSIWQRPTYSSADRGALYGSATWEALEFRDIDGAGWSELLLRHAEWLGTSDLWPQRYYELHMPGAVAFRWDGNSYVPAYFVAEGRAAALRLRLPLHLAPRLSLPLTVDGDPTDWWQIEYRESLIVRPNDEDVSYLKFNVAWDQQYLYIIRSHIPGTFSFALDTDLAGDQDTAALNEDDFVWNVALTGHDQCLVTATVQGAAAKDLDGKYRIAAALGPYGAGCIVEIAIPLQALGLCGEELVAGTGWTSGDLDPHGIREYHPRAGKVIGFAAQVDPAELSPYQWDNPTTWANLVFIADR